MCRGLRAESTWAYRRGDARYPPLKQKGSEPNLFCPGLTKNGAFCLGQSLVKAEVAAVERFGGQNYWQNPTNGDTSHYVVWEATCGGT